MQQTQAADEQVGDTHRVSGVVGVHVGAQAGVELRAAVQRTRRRARDDAGHAVERDGAHVEQHRRDVQQRSEEEDRLPPQQRGEHHPRRPPHGASAPHSSGRACPRPRPRRPALPRRPPPRPPPRRRGGGGEPERRGKGRRTACVRRVTPRARVRGRVGAGPSAALVAARWWWTGGLP